MELAPVIMESEMSRHGRADDIVLVQIQRPENQKIRWSKFQSQSKAEVSRKLMSQLEERQNENSF